MGNEKIVKLLSGELILVDVDDHIGREIIEYGVYDECAVAFIIDAVRRIDSPLIIDVGANIGNHLIPVLKFVDKAIAFEPQPEIANMLLKTININNFKNCIVENYGLGINEESLSFYQNISGNNGNSSFLQEKTEEDVKKLNLPVKNGDAELGRLGINKLDFIKIDVEGFEYEVLSGMSKTINEYSPMILIEWNSQNTRDKFIENEMFDGVLSGYKVLSLKPSRYMHGRLIRKIARFLLKKFGFKLWVLSEFEYDMSYANILLYKKQHEKIINSLQ